MCPHSVRCRADTDVLGSVVQSIVSLTSSLMVKMLTVLVSAIHVSNSQVFLLKNAKATHFFSAKILAYMLYLMIKVLTIRWLRTSLVLNHWALVSKPRHLQLLQAAIKTTVKIVADNILLFYAPVIRRMVERAYSVTPIRPSSSASAVSNLHFSGGASVSLGHISSFIFFFFLSESPKRIDISCESSDMPNPHQIPSLIF